MNKKITIYLSTSALMLFTLASTVNAAPLIENVSDNRSAFTNSQIPTYNKFEITFKVNNSTATNQFFPYDTNTPPGLAPGTGITVNALFLPPGQSDWSKAHTTPAFYYQDFDYQVKSNSDWFYPNGNFYWKVRFSPNQAGTWQYKLTAQDASGTTTSGSQSFSATQSSNRGFIRVSPTDSRYFEFEDGTFFPGLGFNMNFSDIAWVNPVQSNKNTFATLKQKGIQLVRMWQSQWAIFGSFWNPWHYIGNIYDFTWLTGTEKYPGSDFSLTVDPATNPCVSFGGWSTYTPASKPSTKYRIRARVKTTLMGNAKNAGSAYGLVIKTGGWLDNCGNSGVGTINSPYISTNSDWTTITGSITTGSTQNFFPYLYLAMENISSGKAYIDYVWVEEDYGNGSYGPNIIPKASMDHYKYIDQRNSYAFDKMLEQASENGIYFKVVGLEKNDVIANLTNFDGTTGIKEQNNPNFYGNYGQPTKIYWLQQAWWRYQQARWGYSPNIHSWELLNEGDPGNGNHWKLTDEMGKFMHCRVFGVQVAVDDSVKCNYKHPNSHLSTTSFWSTYPTGFWNSPKWPNVDYADIHAYISTTFAPDTVKNLMKYDEAYYNQWHSEQLINFGTKKPIIRGEAGLDENTVQSETILGLNRDTQHIWLHNYLWSQLYHGGLYEQYWWWKEHMRTSGVLDPNNRFPKYYAFLKDLPLSNGKYQDAQAAAGNSLLRAWGQKDTTNNRAHLWIQNSKHTWKNVVDNVSISPITTSVTVGGFTPGKSLKVEWWDTYTGTISQSTNITTNSQGQLILPISNLTTDLAVKIGDYTANTSNPTPSPIPTKPGDLDKDGDVDIFDYNKVVNYFGNPYTVFDYNSVIGNFGK